MSFARTDEQKLLGENLRRFLERENEFEHRRKRLAGAASERMALWPQLAELGILGAAFDESDGGFGGDARSIAVVMAEIGRSLAVEPFLASTVIAGHVLARAAAIGVPDDAIGQIIAGQRVSVFAHDAGSDPFALPLLLARLDATKRIVL